MHSLSSDNSAVPPTLAAGLLLVLIRALAWSHGITTYFRVRARLHKAGDVKEYDRLFEEFAERVQRAIAAENDSQLPGVPTGEE